MTPEFNPLVSVVIPVYNGATLLAKAIESALKQTYRNIEIIVVDDGSSDSGATKAVIESYIPLIRSFTKLNGGVASALNLGVQEASGSFVSWLSHDDEYLPGKIQSQIDVLAERGVNCVVYSGYHMINAEGEIIRTINPAELMMPEKLEDSLYPLMRMLIHGCALLIPREAFLRIGMFDESRIHTQDYALWLEMFRAYGLVYDRNIMTLSRVHKHQSSRTIQGRIGEGDALWISFLGKLTVDEMTRMSGSEPEFYREMAKLLSLTPYRKAYANALSLEANAWKRLLTNDPSATVFHQIRFPVLGGSQCPSSSFNSIQILRLFFHVLSREGVKETMRLTLLQIDQCIKRWYLGRE